MSGQIFGTPVFGLFMPKNTILNHFHHILSVPNLTKNSLVIQKWQYLPLLEILIQRKWVKMDQNSIFWKKKLRQFFWAAPIFPKFLGVVNIAIFTCVHATLYVTTSVCRSVSPSVRRSVHPSKITFLGV